jgi:proline dehydrogenase
MGLARNLLLWGSQSKGLQQSLTGFKFFRKAVTRFMPGEDVGSALAAAEAQKIDGISAILTKLGENITVESEADLVARHYLDVLDQVKKRKLDAHISVKLTQLGLDISSKVAYNNLQRLIKKARAQGNFVWIDMENSPYVDLTLNIYRKARSKYQNVGVCLQAYLRRTADDLESLLPLKPAIRLVKGAYAESDTVAFQKKAEVDDQYFKLAHRMLEAAPKQKLRIGIATHDENLIERIQSLPHAAKFCEFQMLYGIKKDLQLKLASQGFKMRVLISYGTYWFPWYMRRLAERPANVWFVAKNLFS